MNLSAVLSELAGLSEARSQVLELLHLAPRNHLGLVGDVRGVGGVVGGVGGPSTAGSAVGCDQSWSLRSGSLWWDQVAIFSPIIRMRGRLLLSGS
jgi:hypothetical protein